MIKERNIVDLNQHRQPAATTQQAITLPQLVISAQRRAKHHLKTLLADFFAKVDDRLFDMADKADNNQQQSMYFEAMRNTRLKKELMEKTYFNELVKGFKGSLENSTSGAKGITTLDQVGLVDDESLESDLAITNMISNAETLFREGLFGLTARLNFLVEDIEITKDNNPLRPEVFCKAFIAAVDCLETDLKVRLVIYKLFDKYVVQLLGPMYNAINADLIAAGVLPRIKGGIVKSEDHHRGGARMQAGVAHGAGVDATQGEYFDGNQVVPETQGEHPDNLFTSLQQLLSMARGTPLAPGAGPVAGGTGVVGGAGIAGGAHSGGGTAANGSLAGIQGVAGGQLVYYAPNEVIGALSRLQSSPDINLVDSRDQASAIVIKDHLLSEISRLSGSEGTKQMGQMDTDAIDIVSMLFDFILDDPSLSDHIKAQLARLQIPMLKVAILDKTFFARKTHPARHLLNEMAYAGGTLDESNLDEDATYQMVRYIVDRILNEFAEDTTIFGHLLQEFSTFIEQERESNRLAEEMLVQARDTAAREIQRRVTDNQVPPLVNNILITAWKDVLIHLCLRDGEDSTAWNTALQVADDLVWSIQPKVVVAERQRLIKVIPRVLNGLRDGLTLIRYDAEATEQLFAGLETLHIASLRGSSLATDAPGSRAAESPRHAEFDNKSMVIEPLLNATESGIELGAGTTAAASQALQDADDLMEEIILVSTQATPWDEVTNDDAIEMTLKEMALGTWVEFIDAQTERHRRGKLAWKCDFTGEFTFVDRKYKVVADISFKDLVGEFKVGRASIVEDIPLFDRALDSVIGGIKNALSRSPAAEPAALNA